MLRLLGVTGIFLPRRLVSGGDGGGGGGGEVMLSVTCRSRGPSALGSHLGMMLGLWAAPWRPSGSPDPVFVTGHQGEQSEVPAVVFIKTSR